LAGLFAAAVFLSAALLFLSEPMLAKTILPRLGGSPAVWNTCMVFFQCVLLAGYALVHWTSRRVGPRTQALILGTLVAAAVLSLPGLRPAWLDWRIEAVGLAMPSSLRFLADAPPATANPIPWVLWMLALAIGLPFLALSCSGPLLQRWFARTDHPSARDPYFLYGASNMGSVLALLAYPLILEPMFPLDQQRRAWAGAFAAFAGLGALCAVVASRRSRPPVEAADAKLADIDGEVITARRRLRWLALAFVPSSLTLGVTTYLSTDIATIPLLWVIPLALYLLSLIVVFSRPWLAPQAVTGRALALAALLLVVLILCEDMQPPIGVVIALHLATLLLAALYCHGELARDRPSTRHLTEFYLWMATGGAAGGFFNALLAPLLFRRVMEYPLVLVAACLFRRGRDARDGEAARCRRDLVLPVFLGGLAALLIVVSEAVGLEPAQLRVAMALGVPAVLCYTFVDRPIRFALGLAALLTAGILYTGANGRPIYSERNFFGTLRVTVDSGRNLHLLVHGNTVHGRQSLAPGHEHEPLSYYSRTGPFGELYAGLRSTLGQARVGAIGLGAGSLASYAQSEQDWTYYEIDPAVERVARDPAYFTFLRDCAARELRVVLGDGRLRLREAPDGGYDVLVLDAFSSDAVPVHLLTREAMRLYLQKLAPHGVLALHLSNRYLDLRPVVATLAKDAKLIGRFRDDRELGPGEREAGKDPSQWAVLARSAADLGAIRRNMLWQPLTAPRDVPVWTDDYSNIVGVFKWQ
jgi:hypothetical protein